MTSRAAESLEGVELANGWKITSLITRPTNATGGFFSVGYEVLSVDGRRGFLKAFDFSRALTASDPMGELQKLVNSYQWERELLKKCRDKKMRRVSTAIADGTVQANGHVGFGALVYYLIFEWAEGGDLRQHLNSLENVDVHFALSSLKHTAMALRQLHQEQIFHQDLKPSNVLLFEQNAPVTKPAAFHDKSKIHEFKVGDLGRSTDATAPAEHDLLPVPGDYSHAPPEQLYPQGRCWSCEERKAADLYQLGSLIFFNFTGFTARNWLHKMLSDAGMTCGCRHFAADLPYLKAAFSKALLGLEKALQGMEGLARQEVINLAKEMCEPNPMERGMIRFKGKADQYAMERYISRLSNLVKRSELGMI